MSEVINFLVNDKNKSDNSDKIVCVFEKKQRNLVNIISIDMMN